MAVRSRDRTKPSIRDLIADDAQVVALESFRPQMVASMIERGRFYKLNDPVVRQWPTHFAVVVPVTQVLGEIER